MFIGALNGVLAHASVEPSHGSDDIEAIYQQGRSLIPQDLDGAIALFEGLLMDNAEELPDRWLAEVQFGLGLAYYHKTFYNLAKAHFTKALNTDHAKNNLDMQVNLYNNLGVVNDLTRQYDAAINNYQLALAVEQDRNRPIEMAEIYNNISLIYYNLNQWDDALRELDRAQALVVDLEAPFIQALIYQNKAINHYALGQFDDYSEATFEALAIYQAIDAHTQELQVMFNLSEDAFRRTGNMDEARRWIEEGLSQARAWDVGVMEAYFLLQAGKLALVENQPASALDHLNQATEQFESLGFEPQSIPDDLYLNLIESYARLGQVDQMLAALADLREAELAREMAVQRASVNELKTQLQFNEQASRLQQQTIELQAQRTRNLRLWFALSIFFVLALAGVGYHRLRIQSLQRLYALNQQAIVRHRQRIQGMDVDDLQLRSDGDGLSDVDELATAEERRGQRWVFQRIEKAMREDRFYRHSGLTVPDLADRLNLSKRLVSESVNAFADATFPEYLNQFRVIHAMERLDDVASDHISIDQILDEAGFSSRSAFYAAFKKACGMTPKEYRKASRRKSTQ